MIMKKYYESLKGAMASLYDLVIVNGDPEDLDHTFDARDGGITVTTNNTVWVTCIELEVEFNHYQAFKKLVTRRGEIEVVEFDFSDDTFYIEVSYSEGRLHYTKLTPILAYAKRSKV